jgi:hypothetical protein
MHWAELNILEQLVAILCIGSFGLFMLLYFVKRIKELIEEIRK